MSLGPCLVCGADSWRPAVEHRAERYRECASCGLERLASLPGGTASYVGGTPYCAHDAHGTTADEAAHRANARRRLALLRDAGALRGTVVDVGCDGGAFADEARLRGWQSVGIAATPEARARIEARGGVRAFASLTAASADGVGPVDVVTFSALERTPSPEHAMADAWAILRPGGLLMVEAWDATSAAARLLGAYWPPMAPPAALFLFSRSTLPRLLVNTGFDRATVRRTARRATLRRAARALTTLHPKVKGSLSALALHTPLANLALSYGLGDLLSVTARKPLRRP